MALMVVWWRFGCSQWQPISDVFTNMGTEDEYDAREERRRQEREGPPVLWGSGGARNWPGWAGNPVVLGRPGVWRVRNAGAVGGSGCVRNRSVEL
ncbi:hypothetical protein ACWD62_42110 [Streptomyces sp. NPDC005146]